MPRRDQAPHVLLARLPGPHDDAARRLTVVDFRYHLVSIIAVFLALAVGIVLGTTTLNGPVLNDLRTRIDGLSGDKRVLENDVQSLRGDVKASDDFAVSVAPSLVAGTLEDQTVLLVVTPETPSGVADRLAPLLVEAGATLSGRLTLLPALADPEQEQLVEDVVAEVVPAGVALPEGEPVERAAVELAAALARQPGAEGIDVDEAQAVVAAFTEADLVQFAQDGDALRQATAVVVLSGPPPAGTPDEAAAARQQAVLSVADAFDDRAGGAVLAGPGAAGQDNGLVRLLRDDAGLAGRLSGVDNVDRGVGLVAVVQAVREQLLGGAGQYGAASGASAPLPSPRP